MNVWDKITPATEPAIVLGIAIAGRIAGVEIYLLVPDIQLIRMLFWYLQGG
jgi:hypothetical protein